MSWIGTRFLLDVVLYFRLLCIALLRFLLGMAIQDLKVGTVQLQVTTNLLDGHTSLYSQSQGV